MEDLLDLMQYRFTWEYHARERITIAWDEYSWITAVHAEEEGQ